MTQFLVRTLSTVLMAAIVGLAVYFEKPGLHSLLGASQLFFTIEISRLPFSGQRFGLFHYLSVASMASFVLSSYYGNMLHALASLMLVTLFSFQLLFSLKAEFKDSLAAFLTYLLNVLISGGAASAGHILIEEHQELFLSQLILVSINDIMAYVCGKLLGKHPLIKLSPSKTWEGYLGSLVFTIIAGLYVPRLLAVLKTLERVYESAVSTCIQAVWIGLVGPIGGLFGSLVKRAAGIKDFGNSIPGHGGFVDRWDCQLVSFTVSLFIGRAMLGKPY